LLGDSDNLPHSPLYALFLLLYYIDFTGAHRCSLAVFSGMILLFCPLFPPVQLWIFVKPLWPEGQMLGYLEGEKERESRERGEKE